MREWLKEHALEAAALVMTIVGVKGLADFWARLKEMFSSYSAEALFSCGLVAAAAAIAATFFARIGYRRQVAVKDVEIAELEKRPTKKDVDELEQRLAAKDAEITALKIARVPTRLDIAKSTLGDEGMRAFRALCAASTYVDGIPSRPLVFSMSDEKLLAIGLSRDLLLLMEEADVIRLSEMDEREVVGSQACETPVDIGCGVTACSDFVKFDLAGGATVEVRPVRLTWGTDIYVANGLYGADLGIASLTSLGSELAVECTALNPPLGMVGYIKDAYSAKIRESRHHFRYLTKDGELRTP